MFISTTIPVADPASVAAASATASAIISSPLHAVLFVLAALCVQLRLLCNMIDGMIAVEGNMQSKLGAVYNEFPDRVADTLFLVAAGYAAQAGHVGVELGWAAALLAASTAYVRAFATAQGLPQDFSGPMAKQHRMFVLTVASLAAAMESVFGWTPHAMTVGLVLIAFGSLITCIKRTVRMANGLESRP